MRWAAGVAVLGALAMCSCTQWGTVVRSDLIPRHHELGGTMELAVGADPGSFLLRMKPRAGQPWTVRWADSFLVDQTGARHDVLVFRAGLASVPRKRLPDACVAASDMTSFLASFVDRCQKSISFNLQCEKDAKVSASFLGRLHHESPSCSASPEHLADSALNGGIEYLFEVYPAGSVFAEPVAVCDKFKVHELSDANKTFNKVLATAVDVASVPRCLRDSPRGGERPASCRAVGEAPVTGECVAQHLEGRPRAVWVASSDLIGYSRQGTTLVRWAKDEVERQGFRERPIELHLKLSHGSGTREVTLRLHFEFQQMSWTQVADFQQAARSRSAATAVEVERWRKKSALSEPPSDERE